MERDTNTIVEQMIVKALTERKRKTDLVSKWEQNSHSRAKIIPFVAMMAAACIAAVFLLFPSQLTCMDAWNRLDIDNVQPVMRAAEVPVSDTLISEGKYEEALSVLESAIVAAEPLKSIDPSDEESAYEAVMNLALRQSLQWKRIYVLSCLERKSEVIAALEDFIEKYGQSDYPAEKYLNILKNNKK